MNWYSYEKYEKRRRLCNLTSYLCNDFPTSAIAPSPS